MMHPSIPAPGHILAGKYRVERVLGTGGMGLVVAAHHLDLDQLVAIKLLLPDALEHFETVSRFSREARAAARIKSEHVARIIDVGELDNQLPYIVMEYLDGTDLCAYLRQRGTLPVSQAVEFVLQACEAIAEAHALGIVHRDLKPANLFCIRRPDGEPSIKVLDFGVSKVTGAPGSARELSMTKTQTILGTPNYMSPEQMASAKHVDARSDIWALGVILFELITGAVPFAATSLPELVLKIVQRRPPPLRSFRPEAPEGLERIVSRCLEKEKDKRYPNIAELSVALADYAPRRARESVDRISRVVSALHRAPGSLSTPPGESDGAHGATLPTWGNTARGERHGRKALIGLGALMSVMALVAAVLGVRSILRLRGATAGDMPRAASSSSLPRAVAASPPGSAPGTDSLPPSPRIELDLSRSEPPAHATEVHSSVPQPLRTPNSRGTLPPHAPPAVALPAVAGAPLHVQPIEAGSGPPSSTEIRPQDPSEDLGDRR